VAGGTVIMPCKVCGADATTPAPFPAAATAGHDLRLCSGCGFVFSIGSPESPHGRPDDEGGDPTSWSRRTLSRPRFASLDRWLRRVHPSPEGRLLDVGSGLGDLALYLSERGWEVWGCDPACDAARACRELLGERFVGASLDAAQLPAASFDVVLMNFSLEHMDEPRAAVSRVRELLRPGGTLAVRVPNTDAALAGDRGALFQLRPQHHCSFFGPLSLCALLEAGGLEVCEVGTPMSLLGGVSLACGLVPALDPEGWMHRPMAPDSLLRAGALSVLTLLSLPGAWGRCRRGEGVILSAAARRPGGA